MSYDAKTDKFEFTDEFEPYSEVVESVFYDRDSSQLLVSLHSNHVYLYRGVSPTIYREFSEGKPVGWVQRQSVGRYYNLVIKRNYGPGEEVDYDVEVAKKSVPAPNMGNVTGNVTATTGGSAFTFTTSDVQQVPNTTFSLAAPETAEETVVRTYEVRFTVDDGNRVKTYRVVADGFDAAATALVEAGEALGLDFFVKGIDIVE